MSGTGCWLLGFFDPTTVATEEWLVGLVALVGLMVLTVVWVRWVRWQGALRLRQRVLEQLALACARGLPLDEALLALGQDLERGGPTVGGRRVARYHAVVLDAAARAREGSLGEALSGLAGFGPEWGAVLGGAEERGALGSVVVRLRQLEAEAEQFQARVRANLIYPLFLLAGVSAAGLVLLSSVVRLPMWADRAGWGEAGMLGASLVGWGLAVLWLGGSFCAAGALREGRGVRLLWPGLGRLRRLRERARVLGVLGASQEVGLGWPELFRLGARLQPRRSEEWLVAAKRAEEGGSGAALLGELGLGVEAATPAGLGLEAEVAARRAQEAAERFGRALQPVLFVLLAGLVCLWYGWVFESYAVWVEGVL